MSQPVVVVATAEPAPDGTPSADFAAGAATVVAAAAADEAAHAADLSSSAADKASAALSEAYSGAAEAADAHDRIDRIEAFLEDLVVVLNDGLPDPIADQLPEPPDDGAPPPAEPVGDPEPVTEPGKVKKARSGKWGSDGWFGGRD